MLIELRSKAGTLCRSATEGSIRCPLMIRSTSEDVVTDNLFGTLKLIQPRWWLPAILNRALKLPQVTRPLFRTQYYRNLSIELWQKQSPYPPSMLPWKEGITEVDVVIEWENPATTVFVEMKYGSDLAKKTVRNSGDFGYPSDQLIRNLRVGLRRCGWFRNDELLQAPKRDFIQLVITPSEKQHELVDKYSEPVTLRESLPFSHLINDLPKNPMVGFLTYSLLIESVGEYRRFMNRTERLAFETLSEYLSFKNKVEDNRQIQRFSQENGLLSFDDSGSRNSSTYTEITNEQEQNSACP